MTSKLDSQVDTLAVKGGASSELANSGHLRIAKGDKNWPENPTEQDTLEFTGFLDTTLSSRRGCSGEEELD